MLCDLEPGDEVILPSFTFVSTANAFVRRGARPVFVDIRPDTLNLDEAPDRGRHHPADQGDLPGPLRRRGLRDGPDHGHRRAGTACWWSRTPPRASTPSTTAGPSGSIGHLGCYSFHETKNFICGEGGALLHQRPRAGRAGRDHPRQGHQPQAVLPRPGRQVHLGRRRLVATCPARSARRSSTPSSRCSTPSARGGERIYQFYRQHLKPLEAEGLLRLPHVPEDCASNYHMFYILLPDRRDRATA